MNNLYWTLLRYGTWNVYLAATELGLCYVGSPNAPFDELTDWAGKQLPKAVLVRDEAAMDTYADALRAYFDGASRAFAIPLDLRGTAFQRQVWEQLLLIPHGEVCAYADIAERIGRTAAVRAVGTAIGANPVLVAVPCHRVIGKNGKLTGYRGGMEVKAELLRLEGSLTDAR